MITPHPTSKIDPALARGTLGQPPAHKVNTPPCITFLVPNSNYELHLHPTREVSVALGKRLIGVISVQARRIDTPTAGGQFVEPVMGRPRRVQGTVLAHADGALVVDAGVVVHVTPTDPRQKAQDFSPGQLVSFDALDGATFTPR